MMLVSQLDDLKGSVATPDVCIIGSGPAGLTLALELENKGLQVLVLEAGGEFYDEESQSFFAAKVVGSPLFDLKINRLRYFGGSANHWGGFCRPLDEWDFREKIPGIPSSWPIARADLQPYLARASDILELPCFPKDRLLSQDLIEVHWTYSPPVNFAYKYGDHFRASRRVTVALNACVTNLVERSGRIEAVEICGRDGTRSPLRAGKFVLCAGGVENSRILLWANERNQQRVVRDTTCLGKYWMEHPHYSVADALITTDPRLDPDRKGRAYVAPTVTAIKARRMLNCALRVEPVDYQGTRRLIADLACIAPDLGRWAIERAGKRLVCGYRIRAAWEQAPREENQIRLTRELDPFGVPRAELHWGFSSLEKHTVREATMMLGEYLAKKGYGRIRLLPWLADPNSGFPADDEHVGNHHMGGTRMSADSRQGVVDRDCRVHGIENLFVCGSSVFPSAGHANPTLTIVQLALRLADHIARRRGSGLGA